MYTYLGTLKEGYNYNKDLKLYLKNKNIKVVRNLKKLKILIITSEKEISINDFECFEILEVERKNFTV
jgi:hypothetical protein